MQTPGKRGPFVCTITNALARWDITITPEQIDQLQAHFQAVVEANRTMNLTRITDPVEAAIKHYADSLALLLWVRAREPSVQTLLDVGTGAGFPAVPLAIMRPEWSVTAIDATGKKIDFLQRTVAAIGLKNVHCEHAHSRHWTPSAISRQPPGPGFDLVVFRALTSLSKSLEQTAGYMAPGGWLVAYQTASVNPNEQNLAQQVCTKMGLHAHERFAYDLVVGSEKLYRMLYVYRRTHECCPTRAM